MGCDIHIEVETLTAAGWRHVYGAIPNGLHAVADPDPTDRSYLVFGRLADVRSPDDRGAIAADRRLPPDFDRAAAAAEHADYWADGACPPDPEYTPGDHSFTWATVAELLAADWTHVDGAEVWDLSNHGLVLWLRGPAVAALVEQAGGANRVRLVIGFDS